MKSRKDLRSGVPNECELQVTHITAVIKRCYKSNESINNRPFSYSEKESQSNDTLLHLVEFSNVHNSDRSSNATRSNFG